MQPFAPPKPVHCGRLQTPVFPSMFARMAERRLQGIWCAVICAALCAVFAALAWSAIERKSATTDEPSHTAIAWLMLWQHDFRVSPDVPPLWEDWIGLGIGKDGMHIDASAPAYRTLQLRRQMSAWSDAAMYHTGNDGVWLVNQGRKMALVVGVALAALIGWWAWKLGGLIPAVAATFLYCFDPNFLGHAPLVKNDVASGLVYGAVSYALWKAINQLTWRNGAAIAILTAAAVAVKFSGVLLAPVIVLVLGWRALCGESWMILGKAITCRARKCGAVVLVCLACGVATYVGLWTAYDFRFNAGPDGMQLDMTLAANRLRTVQLRQRLNRDPTDAEVLAWKAPLLTRAVLFADTHRLLPQAWAVGFVHTQIEDQGRRQGYMFGENYTGGKWYYFLLAGVFKSPLSTLAAALIALIVGAKALPKVLREPSARRAAVALIVPAAVYAAATMTADINIGLRHAFPIYPFVFIAMGLAIGRICASRIGTLVAATLAVLLVVETVSAFPNYVAFFNVVARPHRLYLLSDSNFDWGQDMPLLAQWQKNHPDVTLYMDCFGRCDPAAYGITYVNLPDGYPFGPPVALPDKPGVVALSATNIQLNFYSDPSKWSQIGLSADAKPDKILGTTIYLYSIRPTPK